MKLVSLFVVGLIAAAGVSAGTLAAARPLSPRSRAVQPTPAVTVVVADEVPAIAAPIPTVEEPVSQPTPARDPAAPGATEPPKADEPGEGSPSDRAIPPPGEKPEVGMAGESGCCAAPVKCGEPKVRCRSRCGLFRRR